MQKRIPINQNFYSIPPNYLFKIIGEKIAAFQAANPEQKVIKLGIGDAVLPITDSCIQAGQDFLETATKGNPGYPSGEGVKELRQAICDVYYPGISFLSAENIVISTGAKEDSANIQELFGLGVPVIITDPVYPVYETSNLLAGRTSIQLMPCTEENGFLPEIPVISEPSLIYLCFPNNPTGECATREYLEMWVKAAEESGSVIVYDVAYRDFMVDPDLPKSIFEISGAEKVAIEIGSFSKSAGFTGIRVAWTAISSKLMGMDSEGGKVSLLDFWVQRTNFKTNGVCSVQQEMALTALTDARDQTMGQVNYYLENAGEILSTFREIGIKCWGGVNSPYIWAQTPNNMGSWDFFDLLLNQCGVVCTPGEGFGESGKGYFRLSAFGMKNDILEALERIKSLTF